jgi:hypothetical protein
MAAQNKSQLNILYYSTNKVVREILSHAPDGLVIAIAELALNVLHNGKLNISDSDKRKLSKYKNILSVLASDRETLARKRFYVKKKILKVLPLLLQLTLSHVPRNGSSAAGGMEATEGNTNPTDGDIQTSGPATRHKNNRRRTSGGQTKRK